MRLLTWNIQYGLGRDDHYDLGRIAREIAAHEPDVVALQEVDRFWQRSGEVDEPAAIAAGLPGYHWVYGANLDMHAGTPEAPNRRRQFGTMLLSRTPILSSRNFPLPKPGTLKQHSIQQGALEGVVTSPLGRAAQGLLRPSLASLQRDAPAPGGGASRDQRPCLWRGRRLVRRPSRPGLGLDRGGDAADAAGRGADGRLQPRPPLAGICAASSGPWPSATAGS